MTSKKPPSSKRAVLPRASDRTKAFVKDWIRLSHSGRYNMKQLKEAMMLLVGNDGPLGPGLGLNGLTIRLWGIGPTIASATSAVTSC